MPKDTRHYKTKKKPRRRQPTLTDLSAEQLQTHRELQLLRIAGGARPGKHKTKLLRKRMSKLDDVNVQVFRQVQEDFEKGSCH